MALRFDEYDCLIPLARSGFTAKAEVSGVVRVQALQTVLLVTSLDVGLRRCCPGACDSPTRRSCRDAQSAKAYAARSSATRCPARSPWSPQLWRRRRGSGCHTSPAAGL